MGHFIWFFDSLKVDVFRHAEKFYLVIFTKYIFLRAKENILDVELSGPMTNFFY